MNWNVSDMKTAIQEKKYVDTVIIPLVPVSVTATVSDFVLQGEYSKALTTELERQYHGRMVELPSFTYLHNEPSDERLKRLKAWTEEVFAGEFKHCIYVTTDFNWKAAEPELEGRLIWLPQGFVEGANDSAKRQLITHQVKGLQPMIEKYWNDLIND